MTSKNRLAIPLLAMALLALPAMTACGRDEAGSAAAAAETRDSAGIRISEAAAIGSPEIAWKEALALTGEGPHEFGFVNGAVLLPEGRLAVSDAMDASVSFFSAEGEPLASVGGKGAGPGEFMRIGLLGRLRGDSVGIVDEELWRMTAVSAGGELGRVTSLAASPSGEPVDARALLEDGSVAGIPISMDFQVKPGPPSRAEAPLLLFGPQGIAPREVLRIRGPQTVTAGDERTATRLEVPYGENAHISSAGGKLVIADGSSYEVRTLGPDGRPLASVRSKPASARPSEADLAAFRSWYVDNAPPPFRATAEGVAAQAPTPPAYAALSGLVAGADGTLWVSRTWRYQPGPSLWDAFAANGAFLGTARFPEGFHMMDADGNRVAGTTQAGDGTQRVHVMMVKLP